MLGKRYLPAWITILPQRSQRRHRGNRENKETLKKMDIINDVPTVFVGI